MKCDELKDYDYDPDFPFQSRGRFYDADEVNAAIDELKAEHHKERHEYIKMIAELKQKIEEKDAFIKTLGEGQADLAREIERLKAKLEDAKATAYAESVDAGMENRRLKQELRHANYKRCLAMAMWCRLKRLDAADYRIPRKKWEFYDKWYKRWLKISEQFKGAK